MTVLLDISIRHQIYLEGLKNGKAKDLAKSLADLQSFIVGFMSTVDYDDLGDMTKIELNALLIKMRKASNKIFSAWLTNLIQWLSDYIETDCDFWKAAYTLSGSQELAEPEQEKKRRQLIGAFGSTPGAATIYSTARNMPMGANGILPELFATSFVALANSKIATAIAKGYANNDAKASTVKAIVGTKSNNYRDGLLEQLNRQGKAVTDTIIQHVAGITNETVAGQVFDRYLWVSVIDSATTQICRSRNGHVFEYGKGPTPPAHIGCRSSTIAFDGTGPVTMPTFTVWANGQPQVFVNDAFDGELTASYAGSKPIDLKAFAAKRSIILA